MNNNLNRVLRIRTDRFSCSEKTQKNGVNYLLKQQCQWQSGVMHYCWYCNNQTKCTQSGHIIYADNNTVTYKWGVWPRKAASCFLLSFFPVNHNDYIKRPFWMSVNYTIPHHLHRIDMAPMLPKVGFFWWCEVGQLCGRHVATGVILWFLVLC